MSCRACDGPRLVYDGVGSLVCTGCGTLADPAQSVLVDHNDTPVSRPAAPRTSKGWHLAQTKQDRDRKNAIAMGTFISSVLSRLNSPGLSPRAEAIFTQAMAKGHYRWGRKAKLVAGASMAVALREARKSDSLRDIAFFLDDSTLSLSRVFQSVVSILDFSLAPTDPAVHLPILHAYLQSIIHPEADPPSQLPNSLVTALTPLSLQTAVGTATSLSQIVLDHSPPLALAHLPTPPTACALFILGLEAEARAPLPHLGELTRTLGARFALAHGVVSSRYKSLYDLIEEWTRQVPWLDKFVYKGQGRGSTARSKTPKRAIVARGIKDVIQFHEEIRFSRMQNQEKVKLDLELDTDDFANEAEEDQGDKGDLNPLIAVPSSSRNADASHVQPPSAKRRKVERKDDAIRAAYQLLADPSSSRSLGAATSNGETSMLTHLLTCSPEELARILGTAPTRLQMLAASRGGSTEEVIADDELFAVGELEGLLRTEREREALRPLFLLNWGEDVSDEQGAACPRKTPPTETKRGAKRVNMDAFARLLGEGVDGDSTDDVDVGSLEADKDDLLWDRDEHTRHSSGHEIVTDDAELVGDWQPASPDDRAFRHRIVEERYDEEL